MLRNVVVGSRRLGSVVDHEKGVAWFFVSPSFIRTKHFTLEKLLYSQEIATFAGLNGLCGYKRLLSGVDITLRNFNTSSGSLRSLKVVVEHTIFVMIFSDEEIIQKIV